MVTLDFCQNRRRRNSPNQRIPFYNGRTVTWQILQEAATADNLANAVLNFLQNESASAHLKAEFTQLHQWLKRDADVAAASAITQLIEAKWTR